MDYIVSLDQGTSSTRALAFDLDGNCIDSEQVEFMQIYPQSGWVEHNAEEIWLSATRVLQLLQERMTAEGHTALCMGITNQRETTILWDKSDGKPYGNAIVWQDRRTASICEGMREESYEGYIHRTTGLFLDPYFSASKIAWMLDHRHLRSKTSLAFGTVESFLTYKLSDGKAHVTDATNASRTSLMGLSDLDWSPDLLKLFNIPRSIMPDIVDNAGQVATVAEGLPYAGLPITGLIGDQQAAAIGQACLKKGQIKSTYGTGCFILAPTEGEIILSKNHLLTTVASQIKGERSYALEGSIFNAGTIVQWLRDMLGVMASAAESESLSKSVESSEGLHFVTAFTGLGAPYWQADAKAMISGIQPYHKKAHVVRAGLDSIIYQTHDLIKALEKDMGSPVTEFKIDGGMSQNRWFARQLASFCNAEVRVPVHLETTAFGAAFMAGLGAGVYNKLKDVETLWREKESFEPQLDQETVSEYIKGWHKAVKHCMAGCE